MNQLIKRNRYLISAFLLLLLFYLPYIRFRSAAYFTIHDNLDGFFPMLKLLSQKAYFFASGNTVVPELMNGLPRWMLGSPFNLTGLLFYLLPAEWAYIFNLYFVKVLAFISMQILLRKVRFTPTEMPEGQINITALLYALVPFYSLYGLAIAGLPLVFWAFVQIWNNSNTIAASSVLFLISFFSYAPIVTPYLLMVSVTMMAFVIYKGRFHTRMLIPVFSLLAGFVLAEHQLLLHILTEGSGATHRSEFQPQNIEPGNFHMLHADEYLQILLKGTYHSGYLPSLILILTALLLRLYPGTAKQFTENRGLQILGLAICCVLVSYASMYIRLTLGKFIPILNGFSLDRFFFFAVPFWIILAGILIEQIYRRSKWIATAFALLIFSLTASGDEETIVNWKQMKGDFSKTNFKAFYAEDLFRSIETHIGKPKASYRIVSLGMFPGVPLYNGFYCLDAYVNTYPLTYKKAFRPVIEKELEKSELLRNYYDFWGSRCYIFSSELGKNYEFSRRSPEVVKELEINTERLKDMGCAYVFSALPVLNAEAIGLKEDKVFEDENGKWKIYLYKL